MWRLILSDPGNAYTNMAIDEAIFQSYKQGLIRPTLRIYSWQKPSISLGIRQNPQAVLHLDLCKAKQIEYVRRISAGEAIFHDQELTYSLVCTKNDLDLGDSVRKSFKILTAFIINTYKSLGLCAYFADTKGDYTHGDESNFCFATREKFDILINNKKIGGNAQKREKNFIFQHGSLPLALDFGEIKSIFKEKFVNLENKIISLSQALNKNIDFDQLRCALIDNFKQMFSLELNKAELTDFEKELTNRLIKEKYNTKNWNNYRQTKIRENDRKNIGNTPAVLAE
ncbi:MAG: biotin/lipoate A/B protein ligase family protein [Candidatus Omnitrophota bacterium]